MDRDVNMLFQLAQRLLDENRSDACLNIGVNGQPDKFVQALLDVSSPEVRCPRCKTQQYPDARFCHRCGTALPAESEPAEPLGLTFNFAYPHSIEPLQFFTSKDVDLPTGSEFLAWERSTFATLTVPMLNAQQIVMLIDRILIDIQGLKSDANISASIDYGY